MHTHTSCLETAVPACMLLRAFILDSLRTIVGLRDWVKRMLPR